MPGVNAVEVEADLFEARNAVIEASRGLAAYYIFRIRSKTSTAVVNVTSPLILPAPNERISFRPAPRYPATESMSHLD